MRAITISATNTKREKQTNSQNRTLLARFASAHMFGPGTACRCATYTQLPETCKWGKGPYAGTLLIYAQVLLLRMLIFLLQEMAHNHMWSARECQAAKGALLGGSTTEASVTICQSALLHARHSASIFSKVIFT